MSIVLASSAVRLYNLIEVMLTVNTTTTKIGSHKKRYIEELSYCVTQLS